MFHSLTKVLQVQSTAIQPPPSSSPPPPPPPSPPPPSSTVSPVTVVQTQTQQNTQTLPPSTVPPATTILPGPTSFVSSIATVTPTPVVVTSAQAVTVGGSVATQYVTSAPTVIPAPVNQMPKQTREGLSSGAIAGIAVASILGAAAVIAVLVFLLCVRRRRQNPKDIEGVPKRNTSVLSRVGLLRNADPPENEQAARVAPTLPQIRTSGIPVADGGPGSALTFGSSETGENRRFSRPLFSDTRLNPNALMTQVNLSRTSVSTLQDNQDYTRPLEVRNPDTSSTHYA